MHITPMMVMEVPLGATSGIANMLTSDAVPDMLT